MHMGSIAIYTYLSDTLEVPILLRVARDGHASHMSITFSALIRM
jgi:hypothetical protein